MISTGYDLRSFRFGERFVSFSLVWGSSRQETKWAVVSSLGVTQKAGDLEVAAGKKLRKSAAKFMKSLARVNLCAGSAAAVSCADARPNKGAPGLRPKRPLPPS